MRRRSPLALVAILVVLALAAYARYRTEPATSGALADAIAQQRSGVWVEGEGRIVHLLPEDRDPPRHQLCLVELAGGHTIKISHNVDLAPPVPWRKGDSLTFRGRFEWNAKGGVVHWTHRDPDGRQAGGWLELAGQRYR
ncbi:MAG: DUF3465 domain-containing protein [Planctomycetota bacterium]|nr:DUF3465 domain-containing protein [Planctomycetota bacterium]